MNVVVLGLGNPIRTDDGVGVHAIRKLSADCRNLHNVQLIEGGTLGLYLLPSFRRVSHLLALDAVDAGVPAGTLIRFADTGLSSLPASPSEVVLLGIQPHSTDWGVSLSPAVDAALVDLVAACRVQISDWLESTERPVDSASGPKPSPQHVYG